MVCVGRIFPKVLRLMYMALTKRNPLVTQAPGTEPLSVRLRRYRLGHDLTYAKLGVLCGLPMATVRRCCLGLHLTERIAAKIERFLGSVNA